MTPPLLLRRVRPDQLGTTNTVPVDPDALATAARIVEDVRDRGAAAVREHSERLGDLRPGAPLILERPALIAARNGLPAADRAVLERTAARIEHFATAQRDGLQPLTTPVPGGVAGHRWMPIAAAGAYAPGGRYPLPSSVLMTVIPARVAGVETITLASPKPTVVTLAAAAIAGVDQVLAVGGAQAIAALAFGTLAPAADVVVGPGNRFVTAAKKHLTGEVGIDGLAGPSELLVIADRTADPATVAADLLAQAEHDPDAGAILATPSPGLADAVDVELERQLATLDTAPTARAALARHGRAILVEDLAAAVAVSNRLAPEHLELCVENPTALRAGLTAYGGLFIGSASAEVFGDYGAGPNHVLPTARTARFQAGLSVLTFLRPLTFLELDEPGVLAPDVARLARMEGLTAHARSAQHRMQEPPTTT
ncbi:MAG: histidinol dehydrogenase [bacterium]|nr:histidinol dehydrogenase [bacterium]